MWLSIITLLLLGTLGFCREQPMGPCMTSSTATTPFCTLEYTPWMAPQIAPTRTYYEAIMTTWFNIIDCRYCTVTIPDSTVAPTNLGAFTAKTTSPMLTMTRVGCMVETTASTRHNIRGYPELNNPAPRTVAVPDSEVHAHHRRAAEAPFSQSDLQGVANAIATHIDPDNTLLGYKIYLDLRSLNTALFAIQLVQSGLNLTDACRQFRDPATQLQAQNAALDPKQAGDIICWAEMYGFNFGMSTTDLLNKIEAAIYALQVGQNFTTDLNQLCNYLDLSFAGYLGINSDAIINDACKGVNITHTTTSASQTRINPAIPTGFGTAGTGVSNGSTTTKEPGPWSNSTTWAGTAGTVGTGGAWPTGGSGPWNNNSGSETTTMFNGAAGSGSSPWFPATTGASRSGDGMPGSSGNTTGSGSAGNETHAGSAGNATGSGWSGNEPSSSGNNTGPGSISNGTQPDPWNNSTGTGWGGSSTETGWAGPGTAGTGLPWGTGQPLGTGWVSNGTNPLPSGTSVLHGTGWFSNGSWSGYLTGVYGTGVDTWTTEGPSPTDLSNPQDVAVTATGADSTLTTSTTAAGKFRKN